MARAKAARSLHCCEVMRANVEHRCEEEGCAGVLVVRIDMFREYGMVVHDGGSSFVPIAHCPWCGSKLPRSERDRWFAEMRRRGIDPKSDEVPPEFQDGTWLGEPAAVAADVDQCLALRLAVLRAELDRSGSAFEDPAVILKAPRALQQRLASESHSEPLLALLAERGRTKRIRAAANARVQEARMAAGGSSGQPSRR